VSTLDDVSWRDYVARIQAAADMFRPACVAIIAGEPERGALHELFAATYPQLDGYQAQTIRQIPVVILRRR
jgi:hypothetical protein